LHRREVQGNNGPAASLPIRSPRSWPRYQK
jgi:hypothetical protein